MRTFTRGVRLARSLLPENPKVLCYRSQGRLLRSQQVLHMLRRNGVRTERGLLRRRLLRAGPDLREWPVLVVERGLAAASWRLPLDVAHCGQVCAGFVV